jgi:hypothetical protein
LFSIFLSSDLLALPLIGFSVEICFEVIFALSILTNKKKFKNNKLVENIIIT